MRVIKVIFGKPSKPRIDKKAKWIKSAQAKAREPYPIYFE